jgi:GxxExxY protein
MFYYKEISRKILAASFEVYNNLGNGFLEKVYENALMLELKNQGLDCVNQLPVDVVYKDNIVGSYYADIVVENKVIIELKTCKNITDEHRAQILNYLKAVKYKVGYLINFGNESKLEYKRMVL